MMQFLQSLAVYVHDLDPFAFQIRPGVGLRWYGLAYVAGFLAAYLILRVAARRERTFLQGRQIGDFVLVAAIGTVIGGRLGYVLFYRPPLLWTFTGEAPFWGVLAIHEGGMASHGGIVGMVVAAWLFARNIPPQAVDALPGVTSDASGRAPRPRLTASLHLMDLIAFTAPIGIVFGRLANFVNGELYGRVASSDIPWAVKFPQELYDRPELAARLPADVTVPEVLAMIQRGQAEAARWVAGLLPPRHPSQIYAALTEGLAVFLLLAWVVRKPRAPGVVLGWCLIGYAIARFGNEFFRMPDSHLGLQWLGLTRGQWLTTLVFAAGAGVLAWRARADRRR